ncbi:hypothetical protein BD770DRAFT_399495 [Pilaira anomala]|nr:hypothetical protein BD770DRAFT_399495 [Pilaira anomala]
MMTESTESNMLNNTSKLYSNSIQEVSSESGTSIDPIHHRSIEKQPIHNNLSTLSTSSCSSSPLPDIRSIQKTPSDKYMSDAIVGDEDRCKRKFAKMVLAANKFQSQQEKDERPSQMALLFDVHGNIDMMRMVRHGKSEYHKFCG